MRLHANAMLGIHAAKITDAHTNLSVTNKHETRIGRQNIACRNIANFCIVQQAAQQAFGRRDSAICAVQYKCGRAPRSAYMERLMDWSAFYYTSFNSAPFFCASRILSHSLWNTPRCWGRLLDASDPLPRLGGLERSTMDDFDYFSQVGVQRRRTEEEKHNGRGPGACMLSRPR